jgi:AcrR family transcriptional regulator
MPTFAPEMRGKFAKAAFRLFSERGMNNVNMDAIAAEAGVTKGSLYWHYQNRKDLILAACAYYYQTWHARMQALIATCPRPLSRLEQAVAFSVDRCLMDQPSRTFTIEIFMMSLHDEQIRAGWTEFYEAARKLFVELVEDARDAGKIRVSDPRDAVDMMLAALEGIKQRATFEPEICRPSERDKIVNGLLQILYAKQVV